MRRRQDRAVDYLAGAVAGLAAASLYLAMALSSLVR